MAYQDVGMRFTEDSYATKDQVKAAYNMTMIDQIWNKIIEYRSHYAQQLGIKNIDNSPFTFTFSSTIQSKILMIERKLSKLLVLYSSLSPVQKRNFEEEELIGFFIEIAEANGNNVNKDLLLHLVRNDISAFPATLSPLVFYHQTFDYFLSHHYDPIDYRLPLNINKRLSGESDVDLVEFSYRKEELDTPHYYQVDYNYKAAPIKEIERMMNDLFEFNSNQLISPLVRALITLFYIDYIKPYDYFNEETAALFAKTLLSNDDYDQIAFFLLFEGIAFDKSNSIDEVKRECQRTLDLTYYVDHYIDFLRSNVADMIQKVESIKANLIIEENTIDDRSKKENKVLIEIEENAREELVVPALTQTYIPQDLLGKSEVALPIFPSGLNTDAIVEIVQNLLEVYPYLKKSQAHFYATHCTIGKHYTIAQFKKEEEVAYETARTSMDFLADQGFYQKSQVRNKFVYKPIPRR